MHGNYLKGSIEAAGLDPHNLPKGDFKTMNFSQSDNAPATKAWRDIWGSGQGIGGVRETVPVAEFVDRLEREYRLAKVDLDKRFALSRAEV